MVDRKSYLRVSISSHGLFYPVFSLCLVEEYEWERSLVGFWKPAKVNPSELHSQQKLQTTGTDDKSDGCHCGDHRNTVELCCIGSNMAHTHRTFNGQSCLKDFLWWASSYFDLKIYYSHLTSILMSWFQLGQIYFLHSVWYDSTFWLWEKNDIDNTAIL